jgi:hypothetical protein
MDHGGFYTRPFETACQRTTVFPFNSYRFFVLISPWPHEANLELQLKREGETKRRTAVWCCANPGPYEVHINLSFMDIQIFIPMQMDACLCFFVVFDLHAWRFSPLHRINICHGMQGRSGSWFSTRTLLLTLCGGLFIAAAAELWHFGAGALLWERKVSSVNGTTRWKCKLLPGLPGCNPTVLPGSTRFYQGPPGSTRLPKPFPSSF